MSRTASTGSIKSRPSAISTRSFARYEPDNTSPSLERSRAHTLQAISSVESPTKLDTEREDVFEKTIHEENEPPSPDLGRSPALHDLLDDLPVELASFSDRFVESLGAKVYNEPPSIDQLSELFQEFYARASGAISIHISALKSRLNRDQLPTQLKASLRTKTLPSTSSNDSLAPPDNSGGFQQLLTAAEVTERRKRRKLLEHKRILLEEAVEKRVCEQIYNKIWRHKSTLDEVRDEKLRSKTGALSLVGIGLKDLGIEWSSDTEKTAEDVQASLIPAREELAKMNEEHYPLGKLQHLTAAHKAIVDTLYSIHPSSSSADEILPTLIYTLITSPIEGINVISNLYFIQRFRAATKIDGEAAYCLTNLEAAVSFLENVDLASLRADELPEGPRKASTHIATESPDKLEAFPPLSGTVPTPSPPTTAASVSNATGTGVELSPATSILYRLPEKPIVVPSTRHQRTFSDLLQPISNANEAMRSTAEEGFKNMSITLDNSFKFLLGKLKERGTEDSNAEVIVPKTLDEARQLVSRPLTPNEEDHALSESSSIIDGQHTPISSNLTKTEDKILSLLGGRKAAVRERSVDSVKSNEGGKKAVFAAGNDSTSLPDGGYAATNAEKAVPSVTQPTSSNPLESVKSFGTSLNPMSHIGSAFGGAFGRFGSRTTVSAPPPLTPTSPTPTILVNKDTKPTTAEGRDKKTDSGLEDADNVPLRTPDKIELSSIRAAPPISRFMKLTDVKELKIGEINDLLMDYQRLARVLGKLVQRAQIGSKPVQDEAEGSTAESEDENS
ncbi:hypothetical protein A1O3_07089 [Capronia epimyces CBS 606.96]|uniref:VPS9 domain-containing protein n=1 Tax=Capronia epimyces CBS 606.96 TaxID=1182542 RepID=W9XTZ2_9EURO|nr:uncharacterized protein A1O3_07089 [Capronia epimyces CBS 606.96]EXJ80805.1 hypothetical protein A1O3_07089 [Capronia epimyces CBS 606.96]